MTQLGSIRWGQRVDKWCLDVADVKKRSTGELLRRDKQKRIRHSRDHPGHAKAVPRRQALHLCWYSGGDQHEHHSQTADEVKHDKGIYAIFIEICFLSIAYIPALPLNDLIGLTSKDDYAPSATCKRYTILSLFSAMWSGVMRGASGER